MTKENFSFELSKNRSTILLMKFKKRSLAKTFRNTSFRLFALQPSTGKMIKTLFIILPVEGCSANSRKLVFLKVLARDRFLNFIRFFILAAAPLSFHNFINVYTRN